MYRIEELIGCFPPSQQKKISLAIGDFSGISEIHIVLGRASCVRRFSSRRYLGVDFTSEDMEYLLKSFTGGALYAHRDTLKNGYITLKDGVRVGVCGRARYEGEEVVGISDVSSFLIRIPHFGKCDFADRLCEAFLSSERGMLIYAPPSGGKTTALRELIRKLSLRRGAPSVSVIDERCELGCGGTENCGADFFRGYKKAQGMEIALRVMSPEVIAVDEIGSPNESKLILGALMSGVRFIATTHGRDIEQIKRRRGLEPLFNEGVFDVFAGIYPKSDGFDCHLERENLKK